MPLRASRREREPPGGETERGGLPAGSQRGGCVSGEAAWREPVRPFSELPNEPVAAASGRAAAKARDAPRGCTVQPERRSGLIGSQPEIFFVALQDRSQVGQTQ